LIPASNILYIQSADPVSRIVLYSIAGDKVKEFSNPEISAIDISDLESGVYIGAFFVNNESRVIKKIFKE